MSRAYDHYIALIEEPLLTLAPQGGMPMTKGGTHLWDKFKKIQDETDKWREWEEKGEGKIITDESQQAP